MRKVGLIAQSFGVKFNPHFWGTGISFAAALHSLSNQPINQIGQNNFPYQNESVLEFDQTPHPIRDAISTQYKITNLLFFVFFITFIASSISFRDAIPVDRIIGFFVSEILAINGMSVTSKDATL